MTGAVVLRMEDVAKRFGPVQALRGVSLSARAGEVLALMGENGAGKSTLLRLMSGVHQPDSGSIAVDGQRAVFATPQAARAAGVRVVVQEPEIIPDVSVAENVYAGALPTRRSRLGRHVVDRRVLLAQAARDLARYGFTGVVRPEQPGRSLSPAQRQVVEILRALTGGARVIAFDEPTSSLSDHEVESLFRLIAQLKAEGIAIIYVSHRLREIFRIADRILVLRDGASVGERPAAGTDESELVRMMVGRDLSALFAHGHRAIGATVLRLRAVTTADVADVSFEVRSGEIVALAGLVGAGRTELAHAIIGDTPILSGAVEMDGKPLALHSPRDAVAAGLALAPEERKQQALLMKRSVRDNICLAVLGRLQRWRIVSRAEESRIARRYVQELRVRARGIDQEVATLSGGNQQKTVLARWLARDAKLLILDEPTRGVDVGAKAEIYAIIDKLAAQGGAILVISSEMPEVLGLADRILVMQGGRIRGELSRAEATEEKILRLSLLEEAA